MDRYRDDYRGSDGDRGDRRRSFTQQAPDSPPHHHTRPRYDDEEDDDRRRKRRHRSWSEEGRGGGDSYSRSSRRRRESPPGRRSSYRARSRSRSRSSRSRHRRRSDRYPSHELRHQQHGRYEDEGGRHQQHGHRDRHHERRRDERRGDSRYHGDDDSRYRRRRSSPAREERRRPPPPPPSPPPRRYSPSPGSRRYRRRSPPQEDDRRREDIRRRWEREDDRRQPRRDDHHGGSNTRGRHQQQHHYAPSPPRRHDELNRLEDGRGRRRTRKRRRRRRNRRQGQINQQQQHQGSPARAAEAAPPADSDHSSQRTNDEPRPISDDDDDVALETETTTTNASSTNTSSMTTPKKSSKKSKKQQQHHNDDDSASRDDSVGHFRGGPGTMIKNRYRVDRQVGIGTFGRVLECVDLQQGHRNENRLVAIKVVRKVRRYYDSAILEADIVKRVNRKGGRGVTHVGVLLESFTYQDHYCMVFEALGFSLYDFMKRHNYQPFPMPCLKEIARQLLETIEFLHSFQLIHTDLKPENVLLLNYRETTTKFRGTNYVIPERPFRVKVIDFGGATYDDEPKSRVVNTRQYRAPEVILAVDGEWSLPSDLWSAGCILAELYVGDLLFATHDNVEHLALMERIIGPFSKGFIKRANHVELVGQAFDLDKSRHRMDLHKNSVKFVRKAKPLEQLIMPEDRQFLKLLRSMLVIDPMERASAQECCRAFRL